jgi:hypothetical protein
MVSALMSSDWSPPTAYLFPVQGLSHLQLPLLGVDAEVSELIPSYQAIGNVTV